MDNEILYDTYYLLKVIVYNKNRYECFIREIPFELNLDYEKVLNARYHKTSRVKRRFVYLLSRYKYIWFCSFTFDKYYISKSTRTKRDLIKNCISQNDFKYILNVDYGDKEQREHYHCILGTNEDIEINEYFHKIYPCISKSILCKNGLDDFQRLSKYIDKLVHHCLKASTKNQRIVYNFKGYDKFMPTYRDKTIIYHYEYDQLFSSST